MSDLDPVTGRPTTSPVPPAAPPAGMGATGFPADRTTTGTGAGSGSGGGGTTDQAKAKAGEAAEMAREKASAAGGAVGEHAGQVTESAKAHAHEVTEEARRQAGHLVEEGFNELRSRAGQQTERAADALAGFSEQLQAMARGERPPEGPLADLVQEGASRVEQVAQHLRDGGYEGALRDVQRFARRRPGMFLAAAFGAGMVAGRLVRNTDTSQLTQQSGGGQGSPGSELERSRGGVPAAMTTGTATTGMPGAPTLSGADPLVAADPTGLQGGPR